MPMLTRILAVLGLSFHCIDAFRSLRVLQRHHRHVALRAFGGVKLPRLTPPWRVDKKMERDEPPAKTQEFALDKAREIASSFSPCTFDPVPWLSNCHIQTVGGVYMRPFLNGGAYLPPNGIAAMNSFITALCCKALVTSSKHSFWDERQRVDTPDGDWFHVDIKYAELPNNCNPSSKRSLGTVLLLHGLESNSKSPLAIDMAKAYLQ